VTGALTALADSPSGGSGVGPGIAVDPAGMFAYATLSKIDNVIAYAIDSSTGNLAAISGSQFYGGGGNPLDITVDPSGQFAYMANYGGGISAFTINSATGGLTAVSGSPFPTAVAAREFGMDSVTVDPTGRFVYAASQTGDDVSAFVIDPSTGALTTVAGSPFPADSQPGSVRVDPSGRYVYVTCGRSNNVWAYSIDGNTGALTMIARYPSDSSRQGSPNGLAIEPSGRFLYVTNDNSQAIILD
jgi:6-phosphogluconolactonase (cycloisomerase 2 family)